MFRLTISLSCFFLLTACGGGGGTDNADAPQSARSNNLNLYSVSQTQSVSACPNGGVLLHFGFDQNENGDLDNSEIDRNLDTTVCHGTDGDSGFTSLLDVSPFTSSSHCNGGSGVAVISGLDLNGDNTLGNSETSTTRYICHGIDGADGVDALNALLKMTTQAPGAQCANGGVRIDSGVDANANGTLDEAEISDTNYTCNGTNGTNGSNGQNGTDGVDGTDGLNALVNTSTESAGANCSSGGVRIESGTDTNNNSTLDTAEITQTRFVCNGTNGSNGQNGTDGEDGTNGSDGQNGVSALLRMTDEPIGSNCANGGVKIDSGLDLNADEALNDNEVSVTQYVCNGRDLTEMLTVLMVTTTEPPGANCPAGGSKISSGIDDNNDDVLQINEVDAVTYSCTVLSEYETLTDIAAASSSVCLHGGVITYVGLDYNGNGVLDPAERQQQTALCADNADPAVVIPHVSYLANVNVAFSASFAVSDPDSDVLSLRNVVKPAWLSLSLIGNNIIASGTPTISDVGQFSVSFTLTDTALSVSGSFIVDTQPAPDNLGTFTSPGVELGEAEFSKILDFEFAQVAAFDREVSFVVDASSTATEGVDFALGYATQAVASGERKTFVELQIIDDADHEGIETIVINAISDAEQVDQIALTLNDNSGYRVMGALSRSFGGSVVIVGEKAELTSGGTVLLYDLQLEATTESCSGYACSSQFSSYWHRYLDSYYVFYGGSTNQVAKYNPVTRSYDYISRLPEACVSAMAYTFQNELLYVRGCQSEYETSTGTLYSYNLLTDTWSLITETGPSFSYFVSGDYTFGWDLIRETNGTLYFYKENYTRLLAYNLESGIHLTETLSSGLNIFDSHDDLSGATRAMRGKWFVPHQHVAAATTKIIEFDPVTKDEIIHEFDIGQNIVTPVFHNGKWFYFGGTNNLGASDRVVSIIVGDD